MKKYDIFSAYIWLVDTIRRKPGGITLAELNEQWVTTDMSGGQPMLRNTFLRHKAAIEQMFGLYIECDLRNGYRYYIGNEHVLHGDSLQNWLLQTLTVSNLVSESMNMQGRILIESVACDSNMLQQLVEAMRQFRAVYIEYQPYQTAGVHTYTVEPYCLKLSRQRWYLLVRRSDGRTYQACQDHRTPIHHRPLLRCRRLLQRVLRRRHRRRHAAAAHRPPCLRT